jgi:hypothetical protein
MNFTFNIEVLRRAIRAANCFTSEDEGRAFEDEALYF